MFSCLPHIASLPHSQAVLLPGLGYTQAELTTSRLHIRLSWLGINHSIRDSKQGCQTGSRLYGSCLGVRAKPDA